MFVITIDQRGSRRGSDLVPALLDDLEDLLAPGPPVLPFVRTVGDEVQGVLTDPDVVVDLVLHLVRRGGWSIGVGAGEGALAESAPASTGAAFVHAREAVERAKGRTVANSLAVASDSPDAALAEGVLQLLASVVAGRTATQWRAIDQLARPGATGVQVARDLGVSPQNVSKLRRDALWQEERDARAAAARLLALAESTSTAVSDPAGRIEA
ncbi:MarR family transcriptional regulator [Serinibacter arcticus]|uniref:SatD family (SatD) n=1 Tax=Serinibacter arcticus TaxID=1655435 RepID=A0A4Z1E4R1_9MICO|nr:MarR family transcriptional regulator [Serinibacter arcticus]TGO04727.1 hypothetical protein SERN_2320 [Serinibacter arcticus]